MLMDMFIDATIESNRKVTLIDESPSIRQPKEPLLSGGSWGLRRTHFHRFMLDVHARIHGLRGEKSNDPLVRVAADIASESPLICFDEFQVTDVADALILHRLFKVGTRLHGLLLRWVLQ